MFLIYNYLKLIVLFFCGDFSIFWKKWGCWGNLKGKSGSFSGDLWRLEFLREIFKFFGLMGYLANFLKGLEVWKFKIISFGDFGEILRGFFCY